MYSTVLVQRYMLNCFQFRIGTMIGLFSVIGNYCYGKLKSVGPILRLTVFNAIAFTIQTCLNVNLPPSQRDINIFLDENFSVVAAG